MRSISLSRLLNYDNGLRPAISTSKIDLDIDLYTALDDRPGSPPYGRIKEIGLKPVCVKEPIVFPIGRIIGLTQDKLSAG